MLNLFALWERPIATWGIVDFIKLIIVIAGCVGVLWVVLSMCEIRVPPGIIKIFWIVLACVVGLLAINIIAGM